MRRASAYWTLVFTAASLEHLAERNVEAADVTGACTAGTAPHGYAAEVAAAASAGSWLHRWRAANS